MMMNISTKLRTLTLAIMMASAPVYTQSVLAADSAQIDVSGGDFRGAISEWSVIIDKIRADSKSSGLSLSLNELASVNLSLSRLLLRRGEAFQRIGFYNKASNDLQESLQLVNELQVPALQSMVAGSLGELYMAARYNQSFTGPIGDPEEYFEKSLDFALDTEFPELITAAAVRMGSWYLHKGEFQIAFGTLEDAVFNAEATKSLLLQVNARVKYARAARLAGYEDDAIDIIRNALTRLEKMPEGFSRAELSLALGREAAIIGGATANNLGVPAFESVVAMAGSLADTRLVGAAFGELARWHKISGDDLLAIEYLERAVGVAADAHDLAIDWELQLARLYRDQGASQAAMASYRRAIRHIDTVRQDIPVTYVEGRSSFQENRAPIYLELADILMTQSDVVSSAEAAQALLLEAQDVVEQLKGSELQDYFRDTCVITQSSSINDNATDGTAVIYPVILADRLALLLSIDGTYYHFSSDVTAGELEIEVNQFADLLRTPSDDDVHKQSSKKIFDWIIAPMLEQLEDPGIKTLLVVPDGVLRTIPLAALWTGDQYLVEKYEIATAPGLTLLNSSPLANTKRRTLVAGLSVPGEVISRLPDEIYKNAYVDTLPEEARLSVQTRGSMEGLRSTDNDDRIRRLLRLPAIEQEVEIPAASKLPSTVLLDDKFGSDIFNDEVLNNSYQIIHVASHGYFDENVENSWIMAHDDLIELGELSALFKPKEFSDYPIELLVLSACTTAEGNDLAPLGLSGVALASGARSVLGSLWLVGDVSTKILMEEFYVNLVKRDSSKASALQAAQIKVLEEENLSHPYYWAPFILVGNWR